MILLGFPSSLIFSFKSRGEGGCGGGLLNRQNPLSLTKAICRRSLINFDVSWTEKPKTFFMAVSTWWLIVVLYQNILITGSKAMRIKTERKYLSVFFVLRETEKVDQKKCSKKLCTLKIAQRWKTKWKLREENGAQDLRDFRQCDIFFMRYFLRLKYFKKFPGNAKIRYWVIQETRLLKPSHIEITLSVNGYVLFVSLSLNIFLNEIREQQKTT